MTKQNYKAKVEMPEGIYATYENNTLKIKGPKGETEKKLLHPRVMVHVEGNLVKLKSPIEGGNASDKMYVNTFKAHIKNLVNGVQKGYIAKLKVCSGHFPMTVTADAQKVTIKNFFGEKLPRTCPVLSDVVVKVQGEEIIIEGVNKEAVGQMAARIESTTSITNRDRRIFQDGCYITEKAVLKDD